MVNLIVSELLKLRRSSIFVLSLVGATAAPVIVFFGFLGQQARTPGVPIFFGDVFSETSFGITLLTGVPLYGVITTYLFIREYNERTIDNLLTIPVSKVDLVFSKLILLFFWIMALTLIAWVSTLLLCFLGRFESLSMHVIGSSLVEFFTGGSLLFLLATPVVLVTLLLKNYFATVVMASAITMCNVMLANSEHRAIFPWSAVSMIASQEFVPEYAPEYSYIVIGLTSLVGLIAAVVYLLKTDVHA